MLAQYFTERHLAPVDPAEQVDPRIARVAEDFYRKLFSRRVEGRRFVDDLDSVVARDFIEDDHPQIVHQDGHVAVRGIAGLRRYRAAFDGQNGPPVLARLETIAVPASQTWEIPGSGGKRYNFGAVLQFTVEPPFDVPGSTAQAGEGPFFRVRLREDLLIEDDLQTGLPVVKRRMYLGVGDEDQGYLSLETSPSSHHELAGQQIGRIAATGEDSPLAPLLVAYQSIFPGVAVA